MAENLKKKQAELENEYKEMKNELNDKERAREEKWNLREKEEEDEKARIEDERKKEREKERHEREKKDEEERKQREKERQEREKKDEEERNQRELIKFLDSNKVHVMQLASELGLTDPEFYCSKGDIVLLKKVFSMLAKQWTLALSLVQSNPNARLKEWLPDDRYAGCSICQARFTFFKRRHHCRLCGNIYCSSCSDHKNNLHRFDLVDVRVCDICHIIIQSMMAQESEKKKDKATDDEPRNGTPPTVNRKLSKE